MRISIIAAIDRNKVIGSENKLPWYLSADLKRFKALTTGKPVIMGRRTFESIGRPLPDRTNIVLTKDKNFKAPGCIIVNSVEDAIESVRNADEVMIIGGASIYRQFLPKASRLYLTMVNHSFEGDVYFPDFNENEFEEKERIENKADEKNHYDYTFLILERRK